MFSVIILYYIILYSLPNHPQESRPKESLLNYFKSFAKGALQRFTPTAFVGVKDPNFQTRLPTMTPQTICVMSGMSSLISSAKWSQRSCSYPSYPNLGHLTPLPGSRPLLDWSHWRPASQKSRPTTSLWYTDLGIQNSATCSRYVVSST